ncbi:glycosyltransferase family 4 protein [Arhodomonas sp. AD133]|uniref:glycosyltransferase family 4 protein n=1 Tax=Arhodomonas sp. AD133 TaxID=3415009 RepID=UPI003EBF8272
MVFDPGLDGAVPAQAGDAGERPLKVLLLVPDPSLAGGVGQFLRTQLEHLSARTCAETMVIGRRGTDRWSVQAAVRPLADCLRLVVRAWLGRYDLLHVNPSMAYRAVVRDGLFLAVARFGGLRTAVVFFHGWDPQVADWIGRSWWRRRMFRATYGRTSHVFVLAESFKQRLIGLGVKPANVEVITTMFDGAELERCVRHVARAPNAPRRVLFLARVVLAKGVHELLDAFVLLHRRLPSVELVIAGDGPELDAVRARVRDLGLEDVVQCPGFVSGSEKAHWLAASDVFVLPTYHPEGCPVALLEAMAVGLPVVASSVGGIPHILENGVNGVVLEAITAETICSALEAVLMDDDVRRRIGECNRQTAWRLYEAGAVTGAIEVRYRAAMAVGTERRSKPSKGGRS